jgi:hypothetical protein
LNNGENRTFAKTIHKKNDGPIFQSIIFEFKKYFIRS